MLRKISRMAFPPGAHRKTLQSGSRVWLHLTGSQTLLIKTSRTAKWIAIYAYGPRMHYPLVKPEFECGEYGIMVCAALAAFLRSSGKTITLQNLLGGLGSYTTSLRCNGLADPLGV